MSQNFLGTSEFFLKYIIQCSFITNVVALLDIPHHVYIWMKKVSSNRKQFKDEVVDDWYFDLGYNFAFSITIFTVIYIFSVSVPLISLFGFIFFALKYFVDKYNFVYVYQTEFESIGTFGEVVLKYSTFGIIVFQLIMCGLFTSIFGQDFIVSSLILLVGEIFYMVVFRFFSTTELKKAFLEELKE